jgi:hypothetical protein
MPIDLYSSSINYRRDLIIAVSDHGKGSDVLRIHEEKPGHYGVRGMYERARNIGASLSIESIPDRGTTVTLRVPGRLAYKDSKRSTHLPQNDRFRGSATVCPPVSAGIDRMMLIVAGSISLYLSYYFRVCEVPKRGIVGARAGISAGSSAPHQRRFRSCSHSVCRANKIAGPCRR